MKKISITKRKGIILLVLLLTAGISFTFYQHHIDAKYNSTEFKSYKKGRLYCDRFFGGNDETDEQLYADMKRDQGMIGC